MNEILEALRKAVREGCWHPALALALTLPDTCAHVAGEKQGRARYIAWCEKYLVPAYIVPLGPLRTPAVFMSGNDCYQLRCAYLHSGEFELDDPKAQTVLSRFRFVAPPIGMTIHRNRINDALQLQVSEFCEEMAAAVEAFLRDVSGDPDCQTRLARLASIEVSKNGTFSV